MAARGAELELSRSDWLAAAGIAALRTAVNDSSRQANRNRGVEGNKLNDVQGCIGELACLKHFPTIGMKNIRTAPLDLVGSVDDVDFWGVLNGRVFRCEVKCEIVEDSKKLFLINKKAYEKAAARDSDCYIPVITSMGSDICYVGSHIKVGDVLSWREYSFRYGDPALGITLDHALCRYFGGRDLREVRDDLSAREGKHVGRDEIEQVFDSKKKLLDEARKSKLRLSDLPHVGLVDSMTKLLSLVPTTRILV